MRLFPAEPHSTAGLSYLTQYLYGAIQRDSCFDGVGLAGFKSKVNASLLAWAALSLSHCLSLFSFPPPSSLGCLRGVGVSWLISRKTPSTLSQPCMLTFKIIIIMHYPCNREFKKVVKISIAAVFQDKCAANNASSSKPNRIYLSKYFWLIIMVMDAALSHFIWTSRGCIDQFCWWVGGLRACWSAVQRFGWCTTPKVYIHSKVRLFTLGSTSHE